MGEALQTKRADFTWKDPLLLEDQLTDEEWLIRDTARSFAQEYLAPCVTKAFREEIVDTNIFRKKMGNLGLLGPTIQGWLR